MSTHEVGISDFFLGEKSSNGEFYFQNGENWVFLGFLIRQISKKTLEKSNKILQMLH
jgi:hypothetical protein